MTHTIDMIDFILTAAAVWIIFCVIRYMLLKKNGSTDMKKLLHLTTAYFYFVILISIMLLPVVLSAPYRGMFSPSFIMTISASEFSGSAFIYKLGDLLLFIPLPVCLYICGVKRMSEVRYALAAGIIFSLGIEILQLAEGLAGIAYRYTGLTDVLLGTAGALAGWNMIRTHRKR